MFWLFLVIGGGIGWYWEGVLGGVLGALGGTVTAPVSARQQRSIERSDAHARRVL